MKHVLVAGGGVVGIACAHYLQQAGFTVTVIDKGTMGGECSHGNCGYICPSHVLPLTEPGAFKLAFKSLFHAEAPFRVKPQARPALARWMMEFARRCTHAQMLKAGAQLKAILDSSLAEYKQFLPACQIECEFEERGLLYVLKSQSALDDFAKTDRLLRDEFDVGATRIRGLDLPDFDPALNDGLAGAFHYEGDCHLRPDLLNRNWVGYLRASGVDVRERCELISVQREAGKIVRVETGHGPMEADHFVFAMGARSTLFAAELGCRIPIEPGKGYSVTMARPALCPVHPMLFPERKVGVTPFRDGFRLGSMMEFAGYDESIPTRRIQQLRDAAEPFLREPHTDQVTEEWFGWRPMTWDSLPIIGPVPGLANATLATGHNMLGVSLAPGTGRLVAELISGAPPHMDPQAFCPSRF